MYSILFACTGNICRSPTAEGVMRHIVAQEGQDDKIMIDSAGLYGYHVGEPPDHRSYQIALERGVSLDGQQARKVSKDDFKNFNLILGMDRGHYTGLKSTAPANSPAQIELFLEYVELDTEEVPDPYYGELAGFEQVFDLIEQGAEKLLAKIKASGII